MEEMELRERAEYLVKKRMNLYYEIDKINKELKTIEQIKEMDYIFNKLKNKILK
jgi:hypothetical protein